MMSKTSIWSGVSTMQVNQRMVIVVLTCGLAIGCTRSNEKPARKGVALRAAIQVNPEVLDDYVGTYRLPSGALFRVIRKGDRLLAGTPPTELLAQSTRRFTSNHFPGEFHFERADGGSVKRVNHRIAKVDHWADRVDAAATADPTRLVDAGGHRLRMLITGEGQPTIVLEDGFGSGIELQSVFQAKLSRLTKVVSYDHAGTGGSDPGLEPRDGQQVARELRTALANAGLEPPFLFIGASIGAEYIQIYAHEFPDQVTGLVLLDPPPDWAELLTWAERHAPRRVDSYRQLHDALDQAMNEVMRLQEPARHAEWLALDITRRQARDALPLPDIPIVQITGAVAQMTSSIMDDKVDFFDESLRRRHPHARHVLAKKSGHGITDTDSELVIDEVRRLLSELR
jgi:pimeloyl-ACP methyl ester carboxylesterase